MTKTLFDLPVVESEALEPGEMVLTDFSQFVVYTVTFTDGNGNELTATGTFELQPDGFYLFRPVKE